MNPRRKSILYMTASILLSSSAQLSMKAGMLFLATHPMHGWPGLAALLDNPAVLWVVLGLTCYGTSLLFWMSAIARLELSLAYPMLSLSWVLVYLVAVNWPLLHEHASWGRSLGIIIVVLGVILIARSDTSDTDQKYETH